MSCRDPREKLPPGTCRAGLLIFNFVRSFPCCKQNKACTLSSSSSIAQPPRLWNKEGRMMQTALRLLDKEVMDKQRALDAALGQI